MATVVEIATRPPQLLPEKAELEVLADTAKNAVEKGAETSAAAGTALLRAREIHRDLRKSRKIDLTWDAWVVEHVGIGSSQANLLMRIARGELTRDKVKENLRARQEKFRTSRRAELSAVNNSEAASLGPVLDHENAEGTGALRLQVCEWLRRVAEPTVHRVAELIRQLEPHVAAAPAGVPESEFDRREDAP